MECEVMKLMILIGAVSRRVFCLRTSVIFCVFALLCSAYAEEPPRRIVSTAPNLTEILFELGLGKCVVGVSDFCNYPEEAKRKPKIGGFVDTSIEAILALRPDLVVLLESHAQGIRQLQSLNVPLLVVRDQSLADIQDAIEKIGSRCGAVEAARKILSRIEQHGSRGVTAATADASLAPRVLVCFGRLEQTGKPVSFYAGARGSLYDELVRLAGGRSAIVSSAPLYPQLSIEGIYATDPDIVIELTGAGDPGLSGNLTGDLSPLKPLRAVRNGHWHVVEGEWAVRPGPRIFQLIEPLKKAVSQWMDGGSK